MKKYEIVTFDPSDEDTFPSVCADPGEVAARFGFVGGEQLLFDENGSYVGQIVKSVSPAAGEQEKPREVLVHLNVEVPRSITTPTLAEDIAAELRGVLEVGVDEDHAPFLSESSVAVALAEEV